MVKRTLLAIILCASQAETKTFLGRVVRQPLLVAHKPTRINVASLEPFVVPRGGGDEYNNDDGERRDYNDRRRNNDYEYQDDRGTSSSNYGYQDDRGTSSSNYGYQDDRGRSGDYRGYENDRQGDYGHQYNEGRNDYSYKDDRYGSSQGVYYDDRGSSSRPSRSSNAMAGIPSMVRHGNKRVGLMLLSFGAIVTFLGISFFFNKALLRLGNLLFIAGVPMTIGPGRTAGYFFQPKKSRATACLGLGIFLVFVGRPIFGMILEFFGFLNLFGNMFPVAFAVLRQMPIVGTLFGGGGRRSSPKKKRSERYYDDGDRDRDDGSDRYY